LFDIDNVIISAASLSLVINSTFKFFIYLSISPGYFFLCVAYIPGEGSDFKLNVLIEKTPSFVIKIKL
jgi:hypothetical protein